jgi:hypothetical protein
LGDVVEGGVVVGELVVGGAVLAGGDGAGFDGDGSGAIVCSGLLLASAVVLGHGDAELGINEGLA